MLHELSYAINMFGTCFDRKVCKDLSRVNRTLPRSTRTCPTCRDWSAAVDSMRPIGASVGQKECLDLHSMRTSRLTRHVFDTLISLTNKSVYPS